MQQYKIQAFAKYSGVSIGQLRHYEQMGLLIPERDLQNNYRYYKEEDLIIVHQICRMQSFGVQLKDLAAENHPYSPVQTKLQLHKQSEHLASQIEQLQRKLNLLIALEMRVPEMGNNIGFTNDYPVLPRYTLYNDDPGASELMQQWMQQMPFAVNFFTIPASFLVASAHSPLPVRIGMEILMERTKSLDIPLVPPVKCVGAFTGVAGFMPIRNLLHPSYDDFTPLWKHLEENNLGIAGDLLYSLRASDTDELGKKYYIRVFLPTFHR